MAIQPYSKKQLYIGLEMNQRDFGVRIKLSDSSYDALWQFKANNGFGLLCDNYCQLNLEFQEGWCVSNFCSKKDIKDIDKILEDLEDSNENLHQVLSSSTVSSDKASMWKFIHIKGQD